MGLARTGLNSEVLISSGLTSEILLYRAPDKKE